MSRRRASKYVQLEAESGGDDYESEEVSEDLDDLTPILPVPKVKSMTQFTQELEDRYQTTKYKEDLERGDNYESEEILEVPSQAMLLPNFQSPLLFLIRYFDVEASFTELHELNVKNWFNINDNIKISKGDLKNMIGTVESLNGNVAIISSNNMKYEVNLDEIEKHYDPGQEVSFRGENGIVLSVKDKKVILGMDNFTREVECLLSEIKPALSEKQYNQVALPRIKVRRDPLSNKNIQIIAGEFKGLSGTVKDAFQNKCIVQLRSNLKCVTIERKHISGEELTEEPCEQANLAQVGGRTPSFKTPGFKTPSYRTPSFKTPIVGADFKYSNNYINEEAGVDWLVSEYDGGEILVNGQLFILADVVGGAYKTKTGEVFLSHEIKYSEPGIYDRVIILEGKDKGINGTLVSITESKGKVKDKDEKEYFVDLGVLTKKAE
ncbi:uncharacterized protein LOC143922155 [Arctopsyche grandis]|uniref:uncharacterized protein LOC143922155 n=1 Tax=Arctopsyche grandis TaxID=121162 RepID=UPI00406D63CF